MWLESTLDSFDNTSNVRDLSKCLLWTTIVTPCPRFLSLLCFFVEGPFWVSINKWFLSEFLVLIPATDEFEELQPFHFAMGKVGAAFTQPQRRALFQFVQHMGTGTEALSSSPVTWSVRVTWPSELANEGHVLWPKRLCFNRIFPVSDLIQHFTKTGWLKIMFNHYKI